MASKYKGRSRGPAGDDTDSDRDRFGREQSDRGMYGYEGEGYMRGGGRDFDSDFGNTGNHRTLWEPEPSRDFNRGRRDHAGEFRVSEEFSDRGYRARSRGYGAGYSDEFAENRYGGHRGAAPRGDTERDSFRHNAYSDFNRGDYARGAGQRPSGRVNFETRDDFEPPSYGESAGVEPGYSRRPSFRGRGPKNYQRSDERVREDVCERLSHDDYIDASEIEVRVADGVVTLTGTVVERNDKRRAEDIAESVSGVKDVENQLRLNRESAASTLTPRVGRNASGNSPRGKGREEEKGRGR